MGELDGKVALVTGGNTGIGRATCLALADAGADVAVNYVAREQEVESLVEAVGRKGRRALAVHADVSQEPSVRSMIDRVVANLGALDILVNGAGILTVQPVAEMTAEDFDRMIAVHLRGTFLCCKYASARMVPRRSGIIINVGSQLAYVGREAFAHYCAAKGGILAFTRAFAREMAPHGIRVNAIAPGLIDTGFDPMPEERKRAFAATLPLKRIGRVEDVAPTVVFLASDASSFYCGMTLSMNGGELML